MSSDEGKVIYFKHVGEYGETRKLYSDSSSDDDDQDGGHEDFIPCA
jgi:hypothetical protein